MGGIIPIVDEFFIYSLSVEISSFVLKELVELLKPLELVTFVELTEFVELVELVEFLGSLLSIFLFLSIIKTSYCCCSDKSVTMNVFTYKAIKNSLFAKINV